MKRILRICCLLLAVSQPAKGDHLLGGEIYYEYVSGSGVQETYRVSLALYGDCGTASTAPAYGLLNSAQPAIHVYNGNALFTTISLQRTGSGVEITPVCPAQAGRTKCTNTAFPVPGVIRYIYTGTVTLTDTSANWRFSFESNLSNSLAGRSSIIGNVAVGANVLICLEATLNNTTGPNNTARCTATPTPFFCINQPQEYNPVCIDPDNDALSFNLVPARRNATASVTYVGNYTFQNPLPVSGTLNFQPATGQMSFTPNLVLNCIVVYRVDEYRNGVRVGSSMREMLFFILPNCNNRPPVAGVISGLTTGSVTGNNEISACEYTNDTLSFHVACTDPNGDNVRVSFTGLPPGASSSVLNNGTPNPQFFFEWDLRQVAPGTYTFYVTLTDDACPLVGGQTIVYTIRVGAPGPYVATANTPLCTGETLTLHVNASPGSRYEWTGPNGFTDTAASPSIPGVTPAHSGRYSVRITLNDCITPDVAVTIIVHDRPVADFTTGIRQGCGPDTVYFTSTGTPAGNYEWDLGDGSTSTDTAPVHIYPAPGTYIVTLYASPGRCPDTISRPVIAAEHLAPAITVTGIQPVRCAGRPEGGFSVQAAGGAPPYLFQLNGRLPVSDGNFEQLDAGRYIVEVTDAQGCSATDTVVITDPPGLTLTISDVQDDRCGTTGDPNGSAILGTDGGVPPYTVFLNGESLHSHTTPSRLPEGDYTVIVRDAHECTATGSFRLAYVPCCNFHIPSAFTPNGDGRNDLFRFAVEGEVVLVDFKIYNRWGTLVFDAPAGPVSTGRAFWDGMYKGLPADMGTYFYTLQYACPGDNRNRQLKGDITLIR